MDQLSIDPGKIESADLGKEELAVSDVWKGSVTSGFKERDGVHSD